MCIDVSMYPVWLPSLARRRALQKRTGSISGMSRDNKSNFNCKQKLTSIINVCSTRYADINYHHTAMFVFTGIILNERSVVVDAYYI